MKKLLFLFILPVMLCTLTAQESFVLKQFGSDTPVCYGGKRSDENVTLPVDYVPKKNEFRGVWVATIESIDFGKHDTAKSFRDDFKEKRLQNHL